MGYTKVIKRSSRTVYFRFRRIQKNGFASFHSQFENLLAFKGETITCVDGEKKITGIIHSVTCDGELNIYLPNKEMKTVLSGDICCQ